LDGLPRETEPYSPWSGRFAAALGRERPLRLL